MGTLTQVIINYSGIAFIVTGVSMTSQSHIGVAMPQCGFLDNCLMSSMPRADVLTGDEPETTVMKNHDETIDSDSRCLKFETV